jgi:hypothetical protein
MTYNLLILFPEADHTEYKLLYVIFIVVPCIFNNVRILLPTNALFIRHIK